MTKLLSLDLRERVVAAVDAGMSRRQAAERFGVGVASAIRCDVMHDPDHPQWVNPAHFAPFILVGETS